MPVVKDHVSNIYPLGLMKSIKRHPSFFSSEKCSCSDNGKKCEDRSCRNVDHMVECESACGRLCQNQRFRRGIVNAPIRLFNKDDHIGTGVKALSTIPSGTVLCEYFGFLKTLSQYKKEQAKHPDRRLYAMEHLSGYVLDSSDLNHIGRNINHSCKPNCKPVPYLAEGLPRIFIISTRQILQGEEISYNYNLQTFEGMDRFVCRCGKKDCVDKAIVLAEKLDIEFVASAQKYTCSVCHRQLASKRTLNAHMRRHRQPSEKMHTCGKCERKFWTKFELKRHSAVHIKINKPPFMCPICPRKYSSKSARDFHVGLHDGEAKRYQCCSCGVCYYFQSELNAHVVKSGNCYRAFARNADSICHLCGIECIGKLQLTQHLLFHHPEYRPYSCNLCGNTFRRKSDLSEHVMVVHKKTETQCDYCGGVFSSLRTLKRHQLLHDPDKKDILCPILVNGFRTCKRRFSSKSNMMRHVKISH